MSGKRHASQDARRRRHAAREADRRRGTANQCLQQLRGVFGEHAEAILRLASEGATPQEIAQSLHIPVTQAESFIDAFTRLPKGVDKLLLRSPSLLGKEKTVKSTIQSMMRAAKSRLT